MAAATPGSLPEPLRRGTLLLLVGHGETPTTGMVLPGRAPGLYLSAIWSGRGTEDELTEAFSKAQSSKLKAH